MGALPYYYLFAGPSFLSGIARVLDLGGSYDAYNFSSTPEEADKKEILDDWIRAYEELASAWIKVLRQNPDYLQHLASACPHELLPSLDDCELENDESQATQRT